MGKARSVGFGVLLLLGLGFGLGLGAHAAPPPKSAPAPRLRFTGATPDEMIAVALARATAPSASEADALAAMLTIVAVADRSTYGLGEQSLGAIARSSVSAEAREEALLLARMLSADEGSERGGAADRQHGVVTELAIAGPFRDNGGGLKALDGPESPRGVFGDRQQTFDWGTVEARWRTVPRSYALAAGVPLDLFVHPRTESCSWIATKVTVTSARPFVVRLAATGQARLVFDGAELGASDDVNASARLDRIAAKVEAAPGPHLVAAKVCSGALHDEGRVRLRVTNEDGSPTDFATSADLGGLRFIGQAAPPGRPSPPPPAAPKVQKLTTPLGRAIAPRAATPVASLDAAILRTLGGADDMKSPRAPGMLATLAGNERLEADTLAMVAFIAPSGSNRSGWLNLARKRAETEGDLATKAFVERRQIAQHVNATLVDWAMAARRAAKLDEATDNEAVLIGAEIDQALGPDALRQKAMQSLAAAVDAHPDAVPSALVRELAPLAQSYNPARALVERERLAKRGEPSVRWVEASGQKGPLAVVAAATQTFEGGLDDADEAIATAHAVSRAGAHDLARQLFTKLKQWTPNRADAWAGLATEIAATSPKDDVEAAGVVAAALRRARELAPGEARYRQELALRQRPGQAPAEARDDERYLVPSATVLARRQGVPPGNGAPDVSDRTTYFLRAVVMHPDRRVSQLMQYAREIVIPPRTQEELVEEIPAEGEQTEILRARVHRKAGGTAFPTEEHNEGRQPKIRWPELLPGDTVEVAIRTWTGGPVGGRGDPPFIFMDFSGSVATRPTLYDEVVIDTPPDHPIYVDVINGKPDRRTDKDEGGRHVTHLAWDTPRNVPDEPLAPALSETVPVTVGSTFKDWADFRAWYGEAVKGFTEPDDEVRKLAADLTRGKLTRDDKLQAIFNFVSDDIRYVNYTSGEWWLPNRPQELLQRREGDCDDKAMLLITLLRAIGIEAQEVMVQTRLTAQPSLLSAKGAAIPYFDHGIAFLPGPNGGTYLDATSPQSRLGPLPSMDARAVALRMDAGPAEVVTLPASSPDDHGADIKWTITLHENGSGDLAGEERHSGDGAFWLRTNMTEVGARVQYVEDHLVGGWFPTVAVDKQVDFKGELAQGQAWVKYRAHSDGLARHEQSEMVVPLSPRSTLASQLAPLVKRTLPVWLSPERAPMHESRTIRVIAPRGYRWAALPPGGDENGGDFGRAHLEIGKDAQDPRAIVVKQSLVMKESVISVDRYAAWRAWLQRVDSLLHKSVRLVGDEPAAPPGRGGR